MSLYSISSKYKSGNPKTYSCRICNKDGFWWSSDVSHDLIISFHLTTEHPESCYKCKHCEDLHINKGQLKEHMDNKHPKQKKIKSERKEDDLPI